MEKALLLGVDGEARRHFIDNAQAGLYFEPENVPELIKCIKELRDNPQQRKQMGRNGRAYVSASFDRDEIAGGFLELLENS